MNYPMLAQLAERHGDAFYLFDRERLAGNYRAFTEAFCRHYPRTQVAYSYKTNYVPAVCRQIGALGAYAEVVSEMEYALARRLGVAPDRIIYNGPCKSPASFREALTTGSIVNLDSERDVRQLCRIAADHSQAAMRVAIRCNFEVEGCRDSRFGMDVDGPVFADALLAIQRLKNVRLGGLHCHFPNREMESFTGRIAGILAVADRVFTGPPDFINVGGGFFGHLPESLRRRYDRPVPSYADYGAAIGGAMAARYGPGLAGPVLFVEPGTALVADTFRFVTRVIDKKQIRSRKLAFVSGSIFNISPYARANSLPVTVFAREGAAASAEAGASCDVVGYTCIEGDVLTRGLPGRLEVDDFLVYENVGSYSIVMKPPFILPNVPILGLPDASGRAEILRQAEPMTYPFEHFVL
jgi:diaminopimelate decarboxylase